MGGEIIVLQMFLVLALLGVGSIGFFVYRCFDPSARPYSLFNLAAAIAAALVAIGLPGSWPALVGFFFISFLAIWPAALLSYVVRRWAASRKLSRSA